MSISIFNSFLEGVVSIVSPCVWPLIPAYLALRVGMNLSLEKHDSDFQNGLLSGLAQSLFYILGFAVFFTLLGTFGMGIGSRLSGHLLAIRRIAGACMFLGGGYLFLGCVPDRKWIRFSINFGMGGALACGWVPCIGPQLSLIFDLLNRPTAELQGSGLLFTYAMGLGIPFLVLGGVIYGLLRWVPRQSVWIRAGIILSGTLIFGYGCLLFTNRLSFVLHF